MPYASTIVHLLDKDGDDFPIRVGGHYPPTDHDALLTVAKARLQGMVDDGKMRPTYPVRLSHYEEV